MSDSTLKHYEKILQSLEDKENELKKNNEKCSLLREVKTDCDEADMALKERNFNLPTPYNENFSKPLQEKKGDMGNDPSEDFLKNDIPDLSNSSITPRTQAKLLSALQTGETGARNKIFGLLNNQNSELQNLFSEKSQVIDKTQESLVNFTKRSHHQSRSDISSPRANSECNTARSNITDDDNDKMPYSLKGSPFLDKLKKTSRPNLLKSPRSFVTTHNIDNNERRLAVLNLKHHFDRALRHNFDLLACVSHGKDLRVAKLRMLRQCVKGRMRACFSSWRRQSDQVNVQQRLNQASQMVNKMSKFSRSFIACNYLTSLMQKKRSLRVAEFFNALNSAGAGGRTNETTASSRLKSDNSVVMGLMGLNAVFKSRTNKSIGRSFRKWTQRETSSKATSESSQNFETMYYELLSQRQTMEEKLEHYEDENQKMADVIKEYSKWQEKLDMVENQLKDDSQKWKDMAGDLTGELDKQKDLNKILTQTIEEKTRLTEQKDAKIRFLITDKDELENRVADLSQKLRHRAQPSLKDLAGKKLDAIDEMLCLKCSRSLEEDGDDSEEDEENKIGEQHKRGTNEELEKCREEVALLKTEKDRLSQDLKHKDHMLQGLENDLLTMQKTLGNQVDMVIKMEEERVELVNRNKEMRARINDLEAMVEAERSQFEKVATMNEEKYQIALQHMQKITYDQSAQTEKEHQPIMIEMEIQTEEKNYINNDLDSISYGVEQSEADSFIENTALSPGKPSVSQFSGSTTTSTNRKKTTSKLPMRSLKFQTPKRNPKSMNSSVMSTPGSVKSAGQISVTSSVAAEMSEHLKRDNSQLAQELVKMNRENNRLKTELRSVRDGTKKGDKEKDDLKKKIVVKTEAIEKLRQENEDLAIALNTDQYKCVRTLEERLTKSENRSSNFKLQLEEAKQESEQLKKGQEEMKACMHRMEVRLEDSTKSDQEFERRLSHDRQRANGVLSKIKDDLKRSEIEKEDQTRMILRLQEEKKELQDEIQFVSASAKSSHAHSEKVLSDIEAYSKILKSMESKLVESQIAREKAEQEVVMLRGRFMEMVNQSMPQSDQR